MVLIRHRLEIGAILFCVTFGNAFLKKFVYQSDFVNDALYRREFISKALHNQQLADKHSSLLLALMQRKNMATVELYLV